MFDNFASKICGELLREYTDMTEEEVQEELKTLDIPVPETEEENE